MVLPKFLRRRYVSPEESCYRRLVEHGYRPGSIIDVGAYEGSWTRLARSIFPSLDILMIEAQAAKLPLLERVCSELPGVRVVSAPLSSNSGDEISFFEMETGSSLLPEESNIPRVERTLRTKTLDEVAEGLDGPIFLKLDVQGAELMVLAGGASTLSRSDCVQLEVAVLPYNRGAPTFLEVVKYMDSHEFVPYDLAGWSRPNGVHLVQVDLLFVRKDSPLRPTFFAF